MPIGDTEPDDAFVVNNIPDPSQVARFLHEERRWLGSQEPEWDLLPEEERAAATSLMKTLLRWLWVEGTDL